MNTAALVLDQERAARVVQRVVVHGEDDADDQHADDEDDEADEEGPAQLRAVLERALAVPVEPRPQRLLLADVPDPVAVVHAVVDGGGGRHWSGGCCGLQR